MTGNDGCTCTEHEVPESPGEAVLEVNEECPVHGGEALKFLDLLHGGKISEFLGREL